MVLPAPNLDDRRFQELVDDAKRMVQQRCPEWTDHNVSDPGVTLIEMFAWMADQLVYRLNRVPDRNYIKFLELMGIELYPATAARAGVTFWLSAPQEEPVTVPEGTVVSTAGTEQEDEVVFTTTAALQIVPCSLQATMTGTEDDDPFDESQILQGGEPFHCFQELPQPGDHLLFGLSNPVPSCAVNLRLECEIEGVGVDPEDPPVVWEAWTGEQWARCDVERDETGGLNRAGDVVIHVPEGHATSVLAQRGAAWVRCRVLEAVEGQPAYSSSPRIISADAVTVGGTATAVNARIVTNEILGLSEGVPGQSFDVPASPVVPDEQGAIEVEVAGEDGWEPWERVTDFSESGPDDRHFALDAVAGQVRFGPAVRDPDGTLRHFGAVPPQGAAIRLPRFLTGGGRRGNVSARKINALRNSIPLVNRVSNRHAAVGGVDTEQLDDARVRGPLLLRTRNRAVTLEDYELLARESAPEVARIRCVADDADEPGGVRVLVVPHAEGPDGQLEFEQLVPADATLERIAAYLEDRRPIGSRAVVEPPAYQGVTVVARLRPRPRAGADRLEHDATTALFRYFHPLLGGPDGDGWPFGRPIHVGEVYSVLQRLDGTEFVEDARLFAADPITGERGEAVERIEIEDGSLVFSYGHQVRVEAM